jgi:transposase
MCPVIDNPASYEIRAVIRFLHAKNMSAAEIHRELCAVYGHNIMRRGTLRQWCRIFKDGRTDVHDEERSGRPSVESNDFVQNVDQKICERQRFTISEISCEFPQISRNVLYEIITVRLGYHKFCARLVPKMLTSAHKTQRIASDLTRLERYHKDGDEFLSHIARVTGGEIWVSFVNVETKEQSKQWMHTHSLNKLNILNECCLSARKLMETDFWDRKGELMVEFMQQGATISLHVYCETLKNCVGPVRTKAWNADIRCSTPS